MGIDTLLYGAMAAPAVVSVDAQQQMRSARHTARDEAARQRAAMAKLQKEEALAMADADDQRDAKRRSIAAQLRRRGRQSTILTDDDTVSSNTLGA